MSHHETEDSYCPLCQQANHCEVASGGSGESCWCQQATIPKGVLAQVPESLRGRACVCESCAAHYQAEFYNADEEG